MTVATTLLIVCCQVLEIFFKAIIIELECHRARPELIPTARGHGGAITRISGRNTRRHGLKLDLLALTRWHCRLLGSLLRI